MSFQNGQVLPSDTSVYSSSIPRDKHAGFLALAIGEMWIRGGKLKAEDE